MFTSDFAEDFSGLSQSEIYRLEKKGVLKTKKEHGFKYYAFGDIYVLRAIKILKREGLSHLNIENAFDYLLDLDPDVPLSSYILLHDNKCVYIVDDLRKIINASQYGQLVFENIIQTLALGFELEKTRQVMNKFVSDLSNARLKHSLKPSKHKSQSWSEIEKMFG